MQKDKTKQEVESVQGIVYPRLMPLKAAAQYLGLTTWAMRERVWAGAIPVVQFPGGRKQYIDIRDLDAFVERNKRTVT